MPQTLSLKIGPSGVRGVVGESLTPQLVTSFAAAFGTYCGAGPILLGTDTRPSAEMVKQAAIAGLLSVGCTPVDLGTVPLPSLMLHVRTAGAFGGMAISGRRGVPEWNALRFISSDGLALRANQAAELTDLYHQGSFPRVRASEISDIRTDTTAVSRHISAVLSAVDAETIRSRRFRVAIDTKGGAADAATRHLLGALGCDVVSLDMPPAGDDTSDVDALGVEGVSRLVRECGAHLGCAQDEDGDRLALVDADGAPLGTDGPPVLAIARWLARQPGPVVANVGTTRAVDDVATRAGVPVFRCRVGEASLVEAMLERGAQVGAEWDGGVVLLPVTPGRDSFVALALVLEAMAVSQRSLAELRADIPRYAMVRDRLLCSARDIAPSLRLIREFFRGESFDLTDGVKVVWPDRWLLARPAATEPVIRLAAEAPTEAEARSLINSVLELLSPGA